MINIDRDNVRRILVYRLYFTSFKSFLHRYNIHFIFTLLTDKHGYTRKNYIKIRYQQKLKLESALALNINSLNGSPAK